VAALCKDAIQNWPETRVLMMTHVKELIQQNAAKMLDHWPDAPLGIYSAGLGLRQFGKKITFAGIQSVRNRAKEIGHVDLIIVDECHLISHKAEGGAHVWADRYDGSLDDIFDLQDQITAQVAGALQPSIRLAEVERASRKRPQDLGAYDYTMRAFRHVWVLEKDEATKALVLLNKALEIDANYPLALALAAWCHAQRSVYNWVNDIETTKAKALAHAEQATNLSADDPLILTVLGAVHTFARNYGAARILLERAVVLDPNAAWAWSRLGWLETYADRPDEALTHFEQALRLSPVDPMNFNNYVGIGSAHQVAGDDIAAADMFLRAINERPNAHWIHRSLAPALWGAGREREARASFDTLKAAYPDMTVKRFKDAMVFSQKFLDRVGAQLLELGLPET
jgi:adenylate cyclase